MAEGRRPDGSIEAALLRLLRADRREWTAQEVVVAMCSQGHAGAPSQVFRALKSLQAKGSVYRILTARGYIAIDDQRRIILACRGCGRISDVPCDAAFGGLDRLSAGVGFKVSRAFVEVDGLCPLCAATAPAEG